MVLKIKKTWLPVLWELNALGTTAALGAAKSLERLGLVVVDKEPVEDRYFGQLTKTGKIVLSVLNKGKLDELNQARACQKYVILDL